nr:hypothetical protein [Tanacetum cinerariifolium]
MYVCFSCPVGVVLLVKDFKMINRRYGISVPALTKDNDGNKLNTLYLVKTNTPYWKYSNRIFWKMSSVVNLDNSTSSVLIPLDSWTSRLLVYKEPLSGKINVSRSLDEVLPKSKNDMPLRDNEGTGVKPGVPDVSKADSSDSDDESWGDSEDESDDVHDKDDNDDDGGNDDDSGNDAEDSEQTDSDDDENPTFTLKYYEEEDPDEEYVHTPEKDKSGHEEEDDDVAKELWRFKHHSGT